MDQYWLCFDAVHRYGAVVILVITGGIELCFDAVHRYGAVRKDGVRFALGCVLMQFIVMVQYPRRHRGERHRCVLMQFIVMVQWNWRLTSVASCCVLMQFIVMVQSRGARRLSRWSCVLMQFIVMVQSCREWPRCPSVVF